SMVCRPCRSRTGRPAPRRRTSSSTSPTDSRSATAEPDAFVTSTSDAAARLRAVSLGSVAQAPFDTAPPPGYGPQFIGAPWPAGPQPRDGLRRRTSHVTRHEGEVPMSDHDEVERAPDDVALSLSRRDMLRLGLLAV